MLKWNSEAKRMEHGILKQKIQQRGIFSITKATHFQRKKSFLHAQKSTYFQVKYPLLYTMFLVDKNT